MNPRNATGRPRRRSKCRCCRSWHECSRPTTKNQTCVRLACRDPDIGVGEASRNSTNYKGVTLRKTGYLCHMSVVATDELCRWCALAFCSSDTLRSNVRISNTRAIIVEHTSED